MSAVLDAEPIVLEALDFDTPCEGIVGKDPCPAPAKWSYWWSCGCISPFCQFHHDAAQEYPTDSWFCEPHNCSITLLRVEPL